jgi:hypothetical protein
MKTIIGPIGIALCLAWRVSRPALTERGHHREGHRGRYATSPTHHHGDHRDYGSASQYYRYVNEFGEGWQPVPAR